MPTRPPHRPLAPTRRDAIQLALAGAAAALTWPACRNRAEAPAPERGGATSPSETREAGLTWEELEFPPSDRRPRPQRALLLTAGEPGGPLLIALHGRGETRSLEIGARAWRDDYALGRAHRRLLKPPLTAADFEELVAPARLKQLNAQLAASPYRGVRVACPYTPDLIRSDQAGTEEFARFLLNELLPEVGRRSGGRPKPEQTGIDGVSLGGRVALLVGLGHPEAFGAVSGLQPAFSPDEADVFAQLAAQARQKRPGLHLRLVSSERDPFKPSVEALSQALRERGLAHHLTMTPGPHDYIWNRGPGSLEMLRWFDQALRPGALPEPDVSAP